MEQLPPIGDQNPACPADVCVTCSDEAVPGRITRLLPGDLALVETGSAVEEISVALVDALVGQTVLVHAGEAIAVVAGGGDTGDMGRTGGTGA